MRRRTLNKTLAAGLATGLAMGFLFALPTGKAMAQNTRSRPFADAPAKRGLSPWTSLGFQGANPLTGSSLGAYQGLVRPQQQLQAQQNQAVQQNRQISKLSRSVNSMQRGGGQQASPTIRATGHTAQFMDTSHFYPSR